MLGRNTHILIGDELKKVSLERIYPELGQWKDKTFLIADIDRDIIGSTAPHTLESMNAELIPYKTMDLYYIGTAYGSVLADVRSECILASKKPSQHPIIANVRRLKGMYVPYFHNGTITRAKVTDLRRVPTSWSLRVFDPIVDNAVLTSDTRWDLITAQGLIVRIKDRAT